VTSTLGKRLIWQPAINLPNKLSLSFSFVTLTRQSGPWPIVIIVIIVNLIPISSFFSLMAQIYFKNKKNSVFGVIYAAYNLSHFVTL